MNKNMKKKALVSSILTIALCFSVIAGATFALFTSESKVNIAVTSGKVNLVANIDRASLKTSSLDVAQTDGKFAAGGAAAFDVEGDDLVLTGVLPGDKATFDIKVTNNSNVDIMYKVKWTVKGELMDALVAKADGNDLTDVTWTSWTTAMDKEDTIEVSVELPRETGNEYQNKGATITFAVEAVQANAIAESVTTADQLVTALENGTGSVTLMNDITVDETIDIPADAVTTLNLNGKSITSTGTLINNNGVLTIAGDGVLDVSAATEKSQVINNYGNLTLKGGTYKGTEVIYSYAIRNYATMTADDANLIGGFGGISLGGGTKTVINDGDYAITGDGGAHVVYLYEDAELTVNGGNFYEALAEKRATYSYTFLLNGADTKVTVNGGNIAGMNMPAGVTVNGGSGTFVINGGTVNGKLTAAKTVIYGGTFSSDPSGFLGAGAIKEDNADGTFSVTFKLSEAMSGGGDITLPSDVEYNTSITSDANINLNGKTFEATGTIELSNNADLAMTGGKYEVNGTYGHVDVRPSTAEGSVVTFENVDFSFNKLDPTYGPSTNRLGSVVEVCATATDAKTVIVFKNCTFDNAQVLFEGMSGKTGEFEATFDGCTFNSLTSSAPIYVQNYVKGTLNVKNCTFNIEATSSTASAISISSSSSTSVTLNAENNTINAVVATPYTYDAAAGETEAHNVKVNGTPNNIKLVSCYGNTVVNVSGTKATGIAIA